MLSRWLIWICKLSFSHPWETVAQAAWRKYPNPMNTNVIGTDVVERTVENGVLHTHRLVSSRWYFPSWTRKVDSTVTLEPHAIEWRKRRNLIVVFHCQYFNLKVNRTNNLSPAQIIGTPKVCYASERSVVDPNVRQMILKTTNVTFGSFLSMDEVLQYEPLKSDPSKTLLRQQATVSIEGVPLNRYMEEVLTKNIHNNANRGRQGLEWVISKINTEVNPTSSLSIFYYLNTKFLNRFRWKKSQFLPMTY